MKNLPSKGGKVLQNVSSEGGKVLQNFSGKGPYLLQTDRIQSESGNGTQVQVLVPVAVLQPSAQYT